MAASESWSIPSGNNLSYLPHSESEKLKPGGNFATWNALFVNGLELLELDRFLVLQPTVIPAPFGAPAPFGDRHNTPLGRPSLPL